MKASWGSLVAMSLVVLAATVHGQGRTPAPLQFESSGQAIETWREGLALAMSSVDDSGKVLSARLELIRDSIYPKFAWGHVRADGEIFAVTPGNTSGYWGMVIDPGHPMLANPMPTLRSGRDAGLSLVYIRPDQVTRRWAGVLMIHELSHLADLGRPSGAPCEGEFHAYSVEREAYNAMTGGRFDIELDAAIGKYGFTDREAVMKVVDGEHLELGLAIHGMERVLGEPAPLSMAEREMRDGFYVVSLIDRIGENTGLDATQRCADNAATLGSASKY